MPKKKPGIYKTKNGRFYKILESGKARFITAAEAHKGKKPASRTGGAVKTGGRVRKKRRRRGGGAPVTTGGGDVGGGLNYIHY